MTSSQKLEYFKLEIWEELRSELMIYSFFAENIL